MTRERLEFLKGAAAHFQKNPQAEEYLGVSRQTCFSVLALHFSSPTEILDPTHPDFLTNLNERVSLFEKNLEQKQPLPQTLVLPDDLEETTQKWQGQSGKTPTISPQLKETFENQLSNRSLKFWQKIKPDVAKKVGGVAGKVKFLGRFIRLAGKAFGPIGIAVTTLLSPSLIKKVLKLIAAALLGFYGLLTLLGTGALTGAAIGALIGGLVGGPAGAAIGATIGAATGYAIEHWFWRPALNAWEGTGGALGGTGNFFGGLLSGAGNALGSFFSGTLSAVGGAATATGTFFTGLGAQLSTLSFATIPTVAIPLFGTIGIAAFGTLLTGTLITGSAFMSPPNALVGQPTPYGACSLTTDTPGSTALKSLFIDAGQWAGVPPAVIAAVASIEGNQMFGYTDAQIQSYSDPGAQDPINCQPNACTARGPMQFTTFTGLTASCGFVFDTWSQFKNAVNQAIPQETRTPEVCNIKDSIYAAASKLKSNSGAGASCLWSQDEVNNAAKGYYGDCTTQYASLGGKTYCQFVWDYYQAHNLVQGSPPSSSTGWFFWQGAQPWGSYSDGLICSPTETVGSAGCGPTSLAMVFKHFGIDTDPKQMWDTFMSRNALVCQGTTNYSAVFVDLPRSNGFDAVPLPNDWAVVESYLRNGYLIVANTNQYGGHFLVVKDIQGNNVITNEPAVSNGEGMVFTKTQFTWKAFWALKK